ncbi:serine hydrolase domain-containing protein [Streptomyces sp. NPDC012746]|uniref:serine hydrolase domain-containing protein n=1 Tax=Streptomyces sp. NPDC012746 TaxID=3364845 RepID=UPI00367D4A2D
MTHVPHVQPTGKTTRLRGRRRPPRRALALTAALAALALTAPAASAEGARAPADRPGAPAGCDAARGALGDSLDTLITRHGIPGAAAEVADPSCGRRSAARGVADLATGRPARAEDRLRIGSVTKTFTATVVVQLAAEGRIGLDAPVERYLPGLIRGNGHDGRRITVRQLLQHTSGLPDHAESITGLPVNDWRYRHYEPRELIATALKLPHPAKTWHYSTTNYVIAGLIVEKVTGRGIEAEVTRRIIEPLGLRDTFWPGDGDGDGGGGDETRIRGAHSRSYFTGPDAPDAAPPERERIDGTEWNVTFGGAGGALISTPADVNRFYGALFGGRLLPARWVAEMKRAVPADPDRLWPGARYGLGLIATPLECGGWWWGHGGTVPGGHRALGAVGPDGRGVALALNQVPATDEAERDFLAVVSTALCAAPGTQHPEETA